MCQVCAANTAAARAAAMSAAGAPWASSTMRRAATPTLAMPPKFPSSSYSW